MSCLLKPNVPYSARQLVVSDMSYLHCCVSTNTCHMLCGLLQVLREMRVKGQLMDHKEIRAAMGVKIVAPGLEHAVAGTSMYVVSDITYMLGMLWPCLATSQYALPTVHLLCCVSHGHGSCRL
jgi:hypothetical protein